MFRASFSRMCKGVSETVALCSAGIERSLHGLCTLGMSCRLPVVLQKSTSSGFVFGDLAFIGICV